MDKPIFGAIAVASALCAASNPVFAKERAVAPQPLRQSQIVDTAQGFVIQERSAEAAAPQVVPASFRVGASVQFDASLVRAVGGEASHAGR